MVDTSSFWVGMVIQDKDMQDWPLVEHGQKVILYLPSKSEGIAIAAWNKNFIGVHVKKSEQFDGEYVVDSHGKYSEEESTRVVPQGSIGNLV